MMTVTDTSLPNFDYESGLSPYPAKIVGGDPCFDENDEPRPLVKYNTIPELPPDLYISGRFVFYKTPYYIPEANSLIVWIQIHERITACRDFSWLALRDEECRDSVTNKVDIAQVGLAEKTMWRLAKQNSVNDFG